MNVIAIYPGISQPPIIGDYKAYQFLKQMFGINTFVATSDKVEYPNSPLNFKEKQQIWTRHGVPIDKIVLVSDPHQAQEITRMFGADRTVVVFGYKQKQANSLINRGYFLSYKGNEQRLNPMNKNGYIVIIPDALFSIGGKFVDEKTIRNVLGSKTIDDEKKKSFFNQVFGWHDISLFDLLKKKFGSASTVKERVNESNNLKEFFRTTVREIFTELTSPQGDVSSGTLQTQQSSQQIAADEKESRKQADQKLKDKEKELKYIKDKEDIDKKISLQRKTQVGKEIQGIKRM